MKPRTFTTEQQARINIVWEHFKQTLEWPSWKALINKHPAEFEHLPRGYSGDVHVGREVSLDFGTILTIPEVHQLLQPLPQLLRLAARRFIEQPTFARDIPRIGINHEDFARVWSDRKQMILAYTLFGMSDIRLGGGSGSRIPEPGEYGPSAFHFGCSHLALRYEDVQSLDEALDIASNSSGILVGANPPEQHQRLMKAIFAHAVRHGEWPVGLPFAIEHKSIGYVPQLITDLASTFVLSGFSSSEYDRICLSIWALPFIDPSGNLRSQLTQAITIIAQLWKNSPADEDKVSVSLVELSNEMKLTPLEAAPLVLLLEDEPWIGSGNFERYKDWRASIYREILDYRSISSWDNYLDLRSKKHSVPPLLRPPPKEGHHGETGAHTIASLSELAPASIDYLLNPLKGLFLPQATSTTQRKSEPTEAPNDHQCEIAIICALRTPELEKVIGIPTKEDWKKLPSTLNDPQTYHQGTYTTLKGRRLRVIAAATNQMGPHAAATLATKIILRFRPRLVAMVGIAAGATIDADGFGDILAPDVTFDYTSGKIITTEEDLTFKPDPNPLRINSRLRTALKDWQADGKDLVTIWQEWPGHRPPRPPKLIIGSLGSGGSVVASRKVIDDVGTHWRKLIGVEMESYAVHYACQDTLSPETPFLALKSVCDFADSAKNDLWQPYAAYTAAKALHQLLISEWENLHLEPLTPK